MSNPTVETITSLVDTVTAVAAPPAMAQPTIGTIRARNAANVPRTAIVSCVVPFAAGKLKPADLLGCCIAGAEVSALEPFGAAWPDGSVRYARAVARVAMDLYGDVNLNVVRIAVSNPPFRFADSIISALDRFRLQTVCDGHVGELDHTNAGNAMLESNAARLVVRYRFRVPGTPLLTEWILEIGNDCDVIPFSCRVVNSDPRDPLVRFNLSRLALRITGCQPVVRHANRLGVRITSATGPLEEPKAGAVFGSYEVELLTNDYIADGQGLRIDGSLLFAPADATRWSSVIAESQFPTLAVAKGWSDTGAWGPFGVVADPPPWMTDPNQWAEDAAGRFLNQPAPARWSGGEYGLKPQSGSTGFQPDFGSCQGPHVVQPGNPALLYAIQDSVIRECYRPLHFFEADGTNVLASRHPLLRVWDGRPHFDPTVSPDQLGKNPRQWLDSHGWSGPDNQHWSFLWLCAYALATGDHATLEEIRHHVQIFLSSQDTAPPLPPGFPTTGMDASRAVGRTLLTSSWYWLLTGDRDVLDKINARIALTITQQWKGQDPSKSIRPLSTLLTDNRQLVDGMPLNTEAWTWQDPIGVTGLAAAHAVTGSAVALSIAKAVARTWTLYGYRGDPRTDGECIAYAAYLGGQPFADVTGQVIWAGGTDFRTWASPCVVLAKRWAHEAGDAVWEAKCDAIIARLQAGRDPRPSGGGWDQFSVWAGGVR